MEKKKIDQIKTLQERISELIGKNKSVYVLTDVLNAISKINNKIFIAKEMTLSHEKGALITDGFAEILSLWEWDRANLENQHRKTLERLEEYLF